ncbi:hypothetical protein [Sphingorhabdus sp. EL138]|uniref:hypothetical protein n=1 Tax=Sphingorhabdus sp. EL138 TaxID=2073156 RepID=UPI0025EAC4DC|nr:hypothetical protein [Sphingorhabdus sp. EL138]
MKIHNLDKSKLLGFNLVGDPLFDVVTHTNKSQQSHDVATGKAVGGGGKPVGTSKVIGASKVIGISKAEGSFKV